MDIVPVARQHGLQKVAIHAVVVNDKDLNHRQLSSTVETLASHWGEPTMGLAP
jgi:hypothetical protein